MSRPRPGDHSFHQEHRTLRNRRLFAPTIERCEGKRRCRHRLSDYIPLRLVAPLCRQRIVRCSCLDSFRRHRQTEVVQLGQHTERTVTFGLPHQNGILGRISVPGQAFVSGKIAPRFYVSRREHPMPTLGYPVEITAPDISAYAAGNTGLEYVATFEASRPGPHAMVSAVVHGNEISGAIVLAELLAAKVRPLRGKLTFVFANPDAFSRFNPQHPTLSRFVDEDFNRLWSEAVLDGTRTSRELTRARALRPLVDDVDYLLDIHSMQYGTEPLGLCGPTEKGKAFARTLGFPSHVVADVGHAAGTRLRDYGAFSDEASPKNALLIECGEHWRAGTVDVAREMARRFLSYLELVEPEQLPGKPLATPVQRVIEVTGPVTVKSGNFRFTESFEGLEVIPKAGTVIGHDGQTPVETPYDECVLIMPSRRLSRGGTAVRFGHYID